MYYNVDTPHGREIMEGMRAKLVSFGDGRGVKGVMNLREIDPVDFGLTALTLTVAGGESSYTLQRDVKENSALCIGGFQVLDELLERVEVWRGNAKLHTWGLQELYSLENRSGVRSDPVYWGPGETMKLIFYPRATSTAAQVSRTWFNGFVLCPDMQSVATRATS